MLPIQKWSENFAVGGAPLFVATNVKVDFECKVTIAGPSPKLQSYTQVSPLFNAFSFASKICEELKHFGSPGKISH